METGKHHTKCKLRTDQGQSPKWEMVGTESAIEQLNGHVDAGGVATSAWLIIHTGIDSYRGVLEEKLAKCMVCRDSTPFGTTSTEAIMAVKISSGMKYAL